MFLYHKFMKENPLAYGHTTSQNCSSSASGSSGFKFKEKNLLFVCGMNFCWATLCLHCWSSAFLSLQAENLFSWGAENHQELSKCTIIFVSELYLKINGNASKSNSFSPFSAFCPQLSHLTVIVLLIKGPRPLFLFCSWQKVTPSQQG